jgi:hypothetical protein
VLHLRFPAVPAEGSRRGALVPWQLPCPCASRDPFWSEGIEPFYVICLYSSSFPNGFPHWWRYVQGTMQNIYTRLPSAHRESCWTLQSKFTFQYPTSNERSLWFLSSFYGNIPHISEPCLDKGESHFTSQLCRLTSRADHILNPNILMAGQVFESTYDGGQNHGYLVCCGSSRLAVS